MPFDILLCHYMELLSNQIQYFVNGLPVEGYPIIHPNMFQSNLVPETNEQSLGGR